MFMSVLCIAVVRVKLISGDVSQMHLALFFSYKNSPLVLVAGLHGIFHPHEVQILHAPHKSRRYIHLK